VREIWSSPLVFRRTGRLNKLCDEALAFTVEAKRRVKVNRDRNFTGVQEGDRILVLGEDEDGKTDDLQPILVKIDQTFSRINGSHNLFFQARLLAPLPKSDDAEEEELLSRNHSSVILNIDLRESVSSATWKRFLTGGDAEVLIWERLWKKHEDSSA